LYGARGAGRHGRVSAFLHHLRRRGAVDRSATRPPQAPLQLPPTAARLAAGALDAAMVLAGWRGVLPQRGLASDASPIDWLSWWDNALVPVLRDGLPGALLLLVLCDPRDMLLDWLQRDSYVRHEAGTPAQMAAWMAGVLDQVAALVEGNYVAHRVVRLDGIADDAAAIASATGAALDTVLSPATALGPGRFPAGRWREYRDVLAGPFATLAPVAQRLGYPDH